MITAALESCRRSAPDVVLMDLEMPVLDGIEATRIIREELPGTAVLVLTSFSDVRRITASLGAGAAGYLLKDSSAEDVVRGIRAAAAGGAPLDPHAGAATRVPGPGAASARAQPSTVARAVRPPTYHRGHAGDNRH